MKRFKKIQTKIMMTIIPFVMICTILLGVVTAVLNSRGTMTVLSDTMAPSANLASLAIEKELDKYWAVLSEAAALDVMHTSAPLDPALITRCEGIASRNGFIRIGKADAAGNASTGENISNEDIFQWTKENMSPSISNLMISTIDGSQIFSFGVPITTNGNFDGIVYGTVDAAFLSDIISSLQMGDSGKAYVLDENGTIIAHPDSSYVTDEVNIINQAESDPSMKELAALHEKMLAREEGFGTYEYEGEQKIFGYSPINGNQNWSIGIEANESEFTAAVRTSILVTVIFAVLIIGGAALIAIMLSRAIAKPIRECAERMQLFEQGDLKSPVPTTDSQDETSVLLGSLERLVGRLDNLVGDIDHNLNEMANGNFSEVIEGSYAGDFASIKTSMRTISSSLNDTLAQINQSSEQVASGAEQVSSGSQALSQGATEQASSVQELAATIGDISNQVQESAKNAGQARDKASEVGENMSQTNLKMQEMVGAMGEIRDTSDEIGKIIKTIEDIAFQTNILALNAAVEAARAGEAGKGFAVVADEVRNLASKSAEASKNTSALIERSITAVKNGTEIADDTAQALVQAVEGANEVVGIVNKIAEASQVQACAIEQVTMGVDQISSVVQTNSATAEESAAASEELSSQSQIMRNLVNKFRLRQE